MGLILTAACTCHMGHIRKNNEDNLYFDGRILPRGNTGLKTIYTVQLALNESPCFGVFDGMGGEAYGEEASFLAAYQMQQKVKVLEDYLSRPSTFFEELIQEMNTAVCNEASKLQAGRMGSTADSMLHNEKLIAACALYETGDYPEAAGAFIEIMDTAEDTAVAQKAFRMLAELYRDCAELEITGTAGLFDKDAVLLEIELLQQGIARYQLYYDGSLYEMLGMAAYQAYEQGYTDYLDVSAEAFRKVLELGVQKEYIYTNLYAIAYMRQDLLAAEEITYSMQEAFPENYLPHAFRAIIYIKAGSDETYDAAFLQYYDLTQDVAYETAYSEYRDAAELIRATDDRTYFLQLESLIQELEVNGWLSSMEVKNTWRS